MCLSLVTKFQELFNALKAIETEACGSSHIIPLVQALALRQSVNLHSVLSLGYFCLTLAMLIKLRCHAHFKFSANQIT